MPSRLYWGLVVLVDWGWKEHGAQGDRVGRGIERVGWQSRKQWLCGWLGDGVQRKPGSTDDKGKLTTQTPAMPYLPSAAFCSMTLALFCDRSSFGFLIVGSAMMALQWGGGVFNCKAPIVVQMGSRGVGDDDGKIAWRQTTRTAEEMPKCQDTRCI